MRLLRRMHELLVEVGYSVYFLFFVFPRWVWLNRKPCPYWDYPVCKRGALVAGNTPCKLGDAIYSCLHYPTRLEVMNENGR